MQIKGLQEKEGSWYVTEYQIYQAGNKQTTYLQQLDWADWDKNGDLLFAKKGKLFRLKLDLQSERGYDLKQAVQLADFSQHRFAEKMPSEEALKW